MDSNCCSCHLYPPCEYCLQKWPCATCGAVEHVDEGELFEGGEGFDDEFMCSECINKMEQTEVPA